MLSIGQLRSIIHQHAEAIGEFTSDIDGARSDLGDKFLEIENILSDGRVEQEVRNALQAAIDDLDDVVESLESAKRTLETYAYSLATSGGGGAAPATARTTASAGSKLSSSESGAASTVSDAAKPVTARESVQERAVPSDDVNSTAKQKQDAWEWSDAEHDANLRDQWEKKLEKDNAHAARRARSKKLLAAGLRVLPWTAGLILPGAVIPATAGIALARAIINVSAQKDEINAGKYTTGSRKFLSMGIRPGYAQAARFASELLPVVPGVGVGLSIASAGIPKAISLIEAKNNKKYGARDKEKDKRNRRGLLVGTAASAGASVVVTIGEHFNVDLKTGSKVLIGGFTYLAKWGGRAKNRGRYTRKDRAEWLKDTVGFAAEQTFGKPAKIAGKTIIESQYYFKERSRINQGRGKWDRDRGEKVSNWQARRKDGIFQLSQETLINNFENL